MRKLPVGQQLHKKESRYNEGCSSCWANSETNDHMLQCPKQSRHRNKIYQAITWLAPEMDPVFHDILRDRIAKYLGGKEQTTYDMDDPEDRGYRKL